MSDQTAVIPAAGASVQSERGVDLGGGVVVTFDTALAMADRLAGAVTLPQAYRKAPDIVAAILTAAQLRLPLMTVINGTHVINGKVTLGVDLMVGAVRGSGLVESWSEVELDDGYQASATRTDGSSLTVSFTDKDAEAAGLKGGNWAKFRKDMMRARAVSRLCRRLFPDVLAGVYSQEEMQDATRDPAPASAPPASAPHDDVVDAEFDDDAPKSDHKLVAILMAMFGEVLDIPEYEEARAMRTEALDLYKSARHERGGPNRIRIGHDADRVLKAKAAETLAHIRLIEPRPEEDEEAIADTMVRLFTDAADDDAYRTAERQLDQILDAGSLTRDGDAHDRVKEAIHDAAARMPEPELKEAL